MIRFFGIALVALIAVGATFLWTSSGRDGDPGGTFSRSAPADPAPSAGNLERDLPPVSVFAPSLRGTEIDGALSVDEHGILRMDRELRRFFDYFLDASGEVPSARIEARIRTEIAARLPAGAAAEANAALTRYLAYRETARELTESGHVPEDLERRLQWIRELRRETLGAAQSEAFFGDQEALDRAAIEWARLEDAPDVSPEERAEFRRILEDALPEDQRQARERALEPLRVHRQEQAIRAAGGSAAEVRSLRERHFDAEAVARLELLDLERSAWQAKLSSYRAQRDALLAGEPASATEGDLENLRREHFAPEELARARALDRIDLAKNP